MGELHEVGRKKKAEEQKEMKRIKLRRKEEDEMKIPSSISVATKPKLVQMSQGTIPNTEDPQNLIDLDRAHGVNPDSKYHWNAQKEEAKNKKRGKKRKRKKESKILHIYKEQ